MVKNLHTNAGDVRDAGSIPDWEDPREEGTATHFSNLLWRNPMDRGTWQAAAESDTTEITQPEFASQ